MDHCEIAILGMGLRSSTLSSRGERGFLYGFTILTDRYVPIFAKISSTFFWLKTCRVVNVCMSSFHVFFRNFRPFRTAAYFLEVAGCT